MAKRVSAFNQALIEAQREGQPSETSATYTPPASKAEQLPEAASVQENKSAKVQESRTARTAKIERVTRGFQMRTDLIKALRRIAFEEDRNLYEVMEEAVEEYLARRK
jgi:hypothetical protein